MTKNEKLESTEKVQKNLRKFETQKYKIKCTKRYFLSLKKQAKKDKLETDKKKHIKKKKQNELTARKKAILKNKR